ncbi:hypothetical protein [Isoptericola sp. 178]|uniref:hypothetical protein n=1 Tax=Isoptericola sp. 178 TaxID=3064651 RepID=UPI002712F81B|nr:hypothetical protein [Isoptericola sp. 178]MDO8144078.1 hypothetical protein [Isoptericola sp. 178]
MTSTRTASAPGRTGPARPPATVGQVRTTVQAEELAARLQHPDRTWPVVVVSTPQDRGRPFVDADRVLDDVQGLAEVVVIHAGDPSWAFSHGMPDATQVYGGASRVYPVGVGWVHDVARSPLWIAYDAAEGTRVHDRLVQDALTAATRAGLVTVSLLPTAPAATSGTVLGLVGTRALVQTADGATAQVAQELTLPVVPIDRLLAPGMAVHGVLDAGTRRLDVRGMLPDPVAQTSRVLAAYPAGAVVPAQVHRVEADEVTLALAPAVAVRVHREHASRGDDDLRDLFTVGEVVAARMQPPRPVPGPAGGHRQPALRLDDVDDTAGVLPAISLLDGGPPWLPAPTVPPDEDLGPEPTTVPEPPPAARPTPGPGPRRAVPPPGRSSAPVPAASTSCPDDSTEVDASPPGERKALVRQLERSVHEYRARAHLAERENVELRAAVRTLEVEVAGLRDLAREQRDHLDRMHRDAERYKARIRSARKQRAGEPATAAVPDRLFTDPEDQLRHDVYRAWAELIGPDEKVDHPLPDYDVGPRFCDSLAGPGRGFEDRVHRAIVMVLTGRAHDVAGYELHRLRRGDGGSDPYRVRESDGAQAMRLSLQVSAPQARRLHYWQLPGGGVELSRVVLHDDVAP